MNATVITIGDELLLGEIPDTNRSFITEQLLSMGVLIKRAVTVPDVFGELKEVIETALAGSDIVVMTGGLGPTNDDVTKTVLCDIFNTSLKRDPEVLENIRSVLSFRNKPLNKRNEEQADIPEYGQVIQNPNGTAPGLWMEKEGKVIVALPGVPFEMRHMVQNTVIPELKRYFNTQPVVLKNILLQGISESQLAEDLETFENQLPDHINLAYLSSPGTIKLRLLAKGNSASALEHEVQQQVDRIHQYAGDYIYGYDNDTLEEILGNLLTRHQQTVATAESCTGGNIARMIASVPGSSAYFTGSVVAYSNAVKQKVLGVTSDALQQYGAVSEAVVREMVQNIRTLYNADYGIAISGIAGPSGGTKDKPVGTTYIAIAGPDELWVQRYVFGQIRIRNTQKASITALHELIKLIKQEQEG